MNQSPTGPAARNGAAGGVYVTSYPKIHNAMWPGVVGKGTGDAEPVIAFDT